MKTRFYVKGFYPYIGWQLLYEKYSDVYHSKEEFEEDYAKLKEFREEVYETMFNKEKERIKMQFENHKVMIKMNDLSALEIDVEIVDE